MIQFKTIKIDNYRNNYLNNYLFLNIKESELIMISMTNSNESFPSIYINNTIILPNNSSKKIGLHFNNELNFEKHNNFINYNNPTI